MKQQAATVPAPGHPLQAVGDVARQPGETEGGESPLELLKLQQQMPGIGAKMFETDMTIDMSGTPDVSLNHTKACMKRCVA